MIAQLSLVSAISASVVLTFSCTPNVRQVNTREQHRENL